ncbi:MAG: hypothetical protein Q7T45_19750 [Bradyrhizobium sp.]|uniref:hypothetical protein n=1 Tax=Bradyrhizobium sp. TaxID=376 RepID=UPI002724B4DA|nr:hypothetical protein [Bradyrhizobium sp.]MDO8400053.1 hypothetical protein [Bradyrhizobium sp.]
MTSIDIPPDSDDTKAALARAFDAVWERFLAIEGDEADTAENRARLATRIVALSRSGDIEEHELVEAALIHLRVLAEAARLGGRDSPETAFAAAAHPGAQDAPGAQGGHAFTPETIAAMSAAFDRCLDELPFRIPSDALKLLSSSILDEASRGERDSERLRLHALDALKARQ